METKLNKDKEDTSMQKDRAGDGMNTGMLIMDKLKNQPDARLGFDRQVYERINKMKKKAKHQEEQGQKGESKLEQWKKEMDEKVEKLEVQISKLEEGKAAMKIFLILILEILNSATRNMEEIAKYLDGPIPTKSIMDLDVEEVATEARNVDSALGGTIKRTKVSLKKATLASSKEIPVLRENKKMQGISDKLANALKNIM